jgi:CheY-like chemotaxis protein
MGGRMPNGGDALPSDLMLEVVDTGVGMDEETRKRCLEPFFSTKGMRGTGLGLAMVYGIMERHEGRIEIESAVSKGTTMRLVFPIRERRSISAAGAPSHSPLSIGSLRVLFVDDEPLLRQLVGDMLRTDGHTVEVADGGQEGLGLFRQALARSEPFDVVITDLGMPGMDGRKLTLLLKQESPETPVIMLTGWGALMRKDDETPLHVECVLSKPPRLSDLRDALRNTVAPQRALTLSES